MALELASHMDLQKVALEERLPIYKADQVVFGWIWLLGQRFVLLFLLLV